MAYHNYSSYLNSGATAVSRGDRLIMAPLGHD